MNVHVLRMARRRRLELVRQWALACAISFAVCFGIGKAKAQDTTGNVVTSCGIVPLQYAAGANRPVTVDINGNLCTTGNSIGAGAGNAGFVSNATPVVASGTGTTGAVTASIAAAAGKFSYLCGFAISTLEGATALATAPTVTGSQATLTWQVQNVASVATQFSQTFSPCIPSSAVNTAITVTAPANIDATAVDVNAWGFQQ